MMIASGELNATKSAIASPNIVPVKSKISIASSSPCCAASNTSFEVMLSAGMLRSTLFLSVVSRSSRAVRATPVAEAYASKQPVLPQPQRRPFFLTIVT